MGWSRRLGALAAVAAIFSVAAGSGFAARPEPYWLGPSFEGLPRSDDEEGFYAYGDCEVPPGEDGGCAPPLQVQNRTTCEDNPVAIDIPADHIYRVRRGGIAALTEGNGIDLMTGRSTVTVFGDSTGREKRAVRALRRRSQTAPAGRLPPPRFPSAVLKELKRIVVARRRFHTARLIERTTGVPVEQVRLRLRLARMLGPRALRGVKPPRRTWRQVQRDRQIGFTALEFGVRRAQRDFHLSRSEVLRAIRRVRGLVGQC